MAKVLQVDTMHSSKGKRTKRGKAADTPYGMLLAFPGFSHGLKTCHRHVFFTAFRIPLSIKITGTQRVPVVFMGWIMGFEPTTFRATI